MRKFTNRLLLTTLLFMLAISTVSYGQKTPEQLKSEKEKQELLKKSGTISVTGKLIRVTPKLADIDRNSMYGKPLVITRDEDGIIGKGKEMEETEERLEERLKEKLDKQYREALKNNPGQAVKQPGGGILQPSPNNPNVPTTTLGVNFNGQTSPGLQPTDNNMAAGPNHVIQVVNNTSGTSFTIWNKAGAVVQPATILSSLTGVAGQGDPIVLYDQLADRWFMAEFGPSTCCSELIIAVSVTANPTGAWKIYTYTDASFFPDYPKFSIWHNAYYAYTNDFNPAGTAFLGTSVWAFDRTAMLAGAATAQMVRQRLNIPNMIAMGVVSLEGMTPSTQNGLFVVPTSATQMGVFEVTPNFVAPSITVSAVSNFAVNSWSSSGNIPQQTGPALGSLSPRMMFRVSYRNNGGTESIVAAHTISNGALGQVRWYELRRTGGVWNVFQQGNVAGTDGNSRWMPGISMDGCGNIALMYDVAGAGSPAANPSIRYTGRNAADPLNTMTLPEATIINGAAGFTGSRWGDYNTTVQDYTAAGSPTNGSFWSTSQYANQLTRIANYTITGGCVPAPLITAGTATLITESCIPANGVIDPGETVTVSFCLQNVGNANTTNLVGTLLTSGGVITPGPPQNYGVLVAGGPAVCKTFTFTNNSAICGDVITATIQCQDGASNLGNVNFPFTLGTTNTVYTENFDAVVAPALPVGWTATNVAGGGALWTTSTSTFVSSPNSLVIDDPTTITDKEVISQSFVSASGARLTFSNNWDLESGFDGGVLEISINGGAYQDIIAAGGSFVTGGYVGPISVNFGSPIAGRQAWTGSSGGFVPTTINMPAAAAGQSVRLKFRMGSDNSAQATGWRVDNIAVSQPSCCGATCTIICPANITTNTTPGQCGAIVVFPAPTTSGLCGPVTSVPASGSFFPRGTTTVTSTTATGQSCQFTITVNDNLAPTVTCPANVTANADAGVCTASVAVPNPTATDNCAVTKLTWVMTGATTGTSPATGINNVGTQTFNNGVTTITYTATDAANNSGTCSFTVTVVDNQAPVFTSCPSSVTRNTDPGVCTATYATPNPLFTDNCGVTALTWVMTGATTGTSPATGINYVGTKTFNLNGTTGSGVTTITYTAKDAAGNTKTCVFTVTVNDLVLPVISAQPVTKAFCEGTTASFTVTATNVTTYQWQFWNGTAWTNVGTNSATLSFPNVNVSQNTNTYRVILTGLCSVVTSNVATLFVNKLPIVTIAASRIPILLPGESVDITATTIPNGGSFVWFKNGVVVPGVSGSSLTGLTVDDIGTYRTVYTDPNGCISTSGDITVSGAPSGNLYVFPNPNLGQFSVRFFNAVGESVTITVFDAKGAKVFQRQMVTTTPYTKLDVDLGPTSSSGVYVVEARNSLGKLMGAKRVLVRHP